MPLRFLLVAVALLGTACGGRTPQPETAQRPIDVLRARAEAAPNDGALWTELALHEHLGDGGEPERAAKALERAEQLGVQPLRVQMVIAERHVLEGRPDAALEAYFKALKLAPASQDPLRTAIAEALVGALVDMNDAVPDYRPRLDAALNDALEHADALGLTATHAIRSALLNEALKRDDRERAEQLAKQAGCLQKARVAGAFGPRELLSFYGKLPADGHSPLKDKYKLGAGRRTAKTRTIETARCVLSLGKGARHTYAGTTIADLPLEVSEAGEYALRVETPNTLRASLDGKALWEVDLHKKPSAGLHYLPVTLSKGSHRLRLRVNSRHPNPSVLVAAVRATPEQAQRTELVGGDSPFEAYLAAKLAVERGATVTARQQLARTAGKAPTAAVLTLQAAVALADPLRPGDYRRDQARELLRRAQNAQPDAWYPSFALADLQAADGRLLDAIGALRKAATRWPKVMAIQMSLANRLEERGWAEEADRVVAQLRQSLPDACGPLGMELTTARKRRRMADIELLSEAAMKCDAQASARYRLLQQQRRFKEAAKELQRLSEVSDRPDRAQALDTELELANLLSDRKRARKLREQRAKLWPDRPGPVLDMVDLALADGDSSRARKVLESAVSAYPDEMFGMRRVQDALGGRDPFAGFRLDGGEVVRAFEASGRTYDQPQVLVLDYTVVRVFEDGSSIDLTHNITRVQSQEAVDQQGELSVPDGARLLKAHTLKADGSTLEPDVIAGKATLSLPNLSPGDYVEFEMTRGASPGSGFPGGYLGQRFYFKSFEVPFDRTELVVIMPKHMKPVLDPRTGAPAAQKEVRGKLAIYRFRVDGSQPVHAEPASVSSKEYLPSINLGVDVSWQGYVESLRDLLFDKDVYDPEVDAAVDRLLAEVPEDDVRARAAKLFRWVTDEVSPTQDVFGVSASMWASRTGSRDRLLQYMLSLAGIDSQLAIVRGLEADQTESKLPDPDTYGHLLVRVQAEGEPIWLHTGERGAPFGYVPAHLRGQPALLLTGAAEAVTVRAERKDEERKDIELEVDLAKDGSAQVHVVETIRGAGAIRWRTDLEAIPEADLDRRFGEAYASRLIPGAQLTSLEITGRDTPEQPLVLDYAVKVDRLGRRDGKLQRIAGLLPYAMGASYARTAERTTTMVAGPSVDLTTRIHIRLPDGAAVASAPEPVELEGEGGLYFASNSRTDDKGLHLERRLRVPLQRVAPAAYAGFAVFCRGVDLAEAAEVAVAF